MKIPGTNKNDDGPINLVDLYWQSIKAPFVILGGWIWLLINLVVIVAFLYFLGPFYYYAFKDQLFLSSSQHQDTGECQKLADEAGKEVRKITSKGTIMVYVPGKEHPIILGGSGPGTFIGKQIQPHTTP